MASTQSQGTCTLCGFESNKAGMTRHLAKCPAEHDAAKGKEARLFRLRVEDAYSPLFWLDVEMKTNADLAELDAFLRGIWLECCGHLSAFTIGGTQYSVSSPAGDFGEETMDIKLEQALSPGSSFAHEYDFGSTTELKLKVIDEREGTIGRESLRLLARNNPPEWTCQVCGEPAAHIHTEELWDSDNPFYCEKHMEASGEDKYLFLPVVNSPRMGVCGYEG